jgi:ribosomal protein RSM22 (predicted rRNA methylase)
MAETFANLPESIEQAIASLLMRQESTEWISRGMQLHNRYISGNRTKGGHVRELDDVMAYLGLRVPASYAQISGAMRSVREVLPSWNPKSVLDLGAGPGTGVWAAKTVWESVSEAVCIDQGKNFITVGKQLLNEIDLPVTVHWEQQDVREGVAPEEAHYDLVIVANVLNELSPAARDKVLGQAFNHTTGVLLILEPGTPSGSAIAAESARAFKTAANLVAPYIDNSYVKDDDFWLHFSQRFIRPEFQRRVRQYMRDSTEMASDWEDAKYSYTAISKLPGEVLAWGRCAGPVRLQKGFLEVPVLTKDSLQLIKVMKRNHEQFRYAKNLKGGELITQI